MKKILLFVLLACFGINYAQDTDSIKTTTDELKTIYFEIDSVNQLKKDLREKLFMARNAEIKAEVNALAAGEKGSLADSLSSNTIEIKLATTNKYYEALQRKLTNHLKYYQLNNNTTNINFGAQKKDFGAYKPIDSVLFLHGYVRINPNIKSTSRKDGTIRFASKSTYLGEGIDSVIMGKSIFIKVKAWDNSGRAIIVEQMDKNFVSGELNKSKRISYTYDTNGHLIEELFQHWYAYEGQWRNEYRIRNEKVGANNDEYYNNYLDEYKAEEKKWISSLQVINSFNSKFQLESIIKESFDKTLYEWVPESIVQLTYHDNGELESSQGANFINGAWKKQTSFTYDSLGRNTETIWFGSKSKENYSFEDGKIKTITYADYDNKLNVFVNNIRVSFSKIEDANYSIELTERWNKKDRQWVLYEQNTNFYDDNDIVIGQKKELWNKALKDWELMNSHIVDSRGNVIENYSYNQNGYRYTYDSLNRKISETNYSLENNISILNNEKKWYYTGNGSEFSYTEKSFDRKEVLNSYIKDTIYTIEDGITVYESFELSKDYSNIWDGQRTIRHEFELGYTTQNIVYYYSSQKKDWEIAYGYKTLFPQGYSTYGIVTEEIKQTCSKYFNEWNNTIRYINKVYNDKRQLEQYEKYEWLNNSWQPVEKLTSTFDIDGKITNQSILKGTNAGNFVDDSRTIYNYNSDGILIEKVNQVKNAEWTNNTRESYSLDSLQRVDYLTYEQYRQGLWLLSYKEHFTYDNLGNIIECITKINEPSCSKGYLFDPICNECIEYSQSEIVIDNFEGNQTNWQIKNGTLQVVDNPDIEKGGKVLKCTFSGIGEHRIFLKVANNFKISNSDNFRISIFHEEYGQVSMNMYGSNSSNYISDNNYLYSYWQELNFSYYNTFYDSFNIISLEFEDYLVDSVFYIDNFKRIKSKSTYFSADDNLTLVDTAKSVNFAIVSNTNNYRLPSKKVGVCSRNKSDDDYAGVVFNTMPIITNSWVEFKMAVKSSSYGQVIIRLQNSLYPDSIYFDLVDYYDSYYSGDWRELSFSGYGGYGTFDQIVLIFDPEIKDGSKWYFDQLVGSPMLPNNYTKEQPNYNINLSTKKDFIYNSANEFSGEYLSLWKGSDWLISSGWINKVDFDKNGNEIEKTKLIYNAGYSNNKWVGTKVLNEYKEGNVPIQELVYDFNNDSLDWVLKSGWFHEKLKDSTGFVYRSESREFRESHYYEGTDWLTRNYWTGSIYYYDTLLNKANYYKMEKFDNLSNQWVTKYIEIETDTLIEHLFLYTNNYYDWYDDVYSGVHTINRFRSDNLPITSLEERFNMYLKQWIPFFKEDYLYESETCELYPEITINTKDSILCNNDYQLNVGIYDYYKWNNNDEASNISINTSGEYTVEVIDSLGCYSVDSIKIAIKKTPIVPSICNVSVNNGNNEITFDDRTNDATSFSLFKVNEMGDFELLTTIDSSLHTFVDQQSNPVLYAETYALQSISNAGCKSALSEEHTTIHLSSFLGHNNENHLIWNGYEGGDFHSYEILRGTSMTNLTKIATVSNMNISYTDASSPEGIIYYQVVAVGFDCSDAKSNINKGGFIASDVANLEDLFIAYPNPFTSDLTISTSSTIDAINVYDLSGQLIMQFENANKISVTLSLSELNSGSYVLQVIDVNSNARMLKVMKN